jgi:hypothetical protein
MRIKENFQLTEDGIDDAKNLSRFGEELYERYGGMKILPPSTYRDQSV